MEEIREKKLDQLLEDFTPKQLRYVAVRPYCNSDSEAADRIGISKSTVYHWGNKEEIDEAVQLLTQDAINEGRRRLKALIAKAIDVIEEELTLGVIGDATRMRAALETLNRGGLSGEQKLDVTSGGKPISRITGEEQERSIKELKDLLKED